MALIPLAEATRARSAEVGGKASRLGELAASGLRVPAGVIVPVGGDASGAAAAFDVLGDVAVAVRSSAIAEDGDTRSHAGEYLTLLDVRGAGALVDAVRAVQASGDGVAVLIQPMIAARFAGVAYTAHPLTGEREVSVYGTRGLGDQLVSGSATAQPLDPAVAEQVAVLAREVAGCMPMGLELEWAFDGETLWLLQARPLAGTPEPVSWHAPVAGTWMRNFRIGEWLAEPPTPLFTSWFIHPVEARIATLNRELCGFAPRAPYHVLVNGWYFTAPFGSAGASVLFRGLARPKFMWAFAQHRARPDRIDQGFLWPIVEDWRTRIRPRWQALGVRSGDPTAFVDEVVALAGDVWWAMIMGGGTAWKMEGLLAEHCHRYLAEQLPEGHQVLLRGLSTITSSHAVFSLDWFSPTAGERGVSASPVRTTEIAAARAEAEERCRSALSGRARARFDLLLELAQRYAVIREEQAAELTLPWRAVRGALHELGDSLVRRGALGRADDIYFVERGELSAPDLAKVAARRAVWQRQRRLSPPSQLGATTPFLRLMFDDNIAAMRTRKPAANVLVGNPASPGRAQGVVRIVHDGSVVPVLQGGEVLVARIPSPALAHVFGRIAALVTDGGSVAAHASLVAREYGIPAVVATGDATSRLYDGQLVTVDGSAGVVEL